MTPCSDLHELVFAMVFPFFSIFLPLAKKENARQGSIANRFQKYNPEQNIWNKIKKSCKVR